MEDTAGTSAAICGVWVDDDDAAGREIAQYVGSYFNQEVTRADLEISFLQDDKKYGKYFVLISRKARKNHRFLLFITRVLYHLHYLGLVSKLVLVFVDGDFKEKKHMIKNLQIFDKVHAAPDSNTQAGTLMTEQNLLDICSKLTEQPMEIKDFLPIGNVGIGLAWSYFYGYLNLILPEITNRIRSSKHYETNGKRMSRKFFIIIPNSGKTPDRFSDTDQRFFTEGPLDEGFKKSRAGQPSRLYKNFVHKIKGKTQQEDFYFCGEFATPVLALRKMLDAGEIDENESERQMVLFRHTLMAILNHKRNLDCNDKAKIVSFADQDSRFSLADQLQKMISSEANELQLALPREDGTLMQSEYEIKTSGSSSFFSTKTSGSEVSSLITISELVMISDKDGKKLAEGITDLFEMVSSGPHETYSDSENEANTFFKRQFTTLSDLLQPKIVDPTVVDENIRKEAAGDKLIIVLTEDVREDVEKHADALIANRIWFPRTTFIVDLEEVPKWLEKSGADYIDSRKNDIWQRIFGSMFGTSSVEGQQDERWQKENAGGIQYQVDRIPVGNVAEGLAWSYHHNYLALLGPTIADRIKKTEYFTQKMMPSKLFILLPYSCFCPPTLTDADQNITSTSAGKLETLTIQIAGNNRNYDTGIHEIYSQAHNKTYYACVEYCTPVLVMYEMEAEGKAGLSPEQKEAQLFVFQRVLQDIMNKSECKQHIKLICYDDHLATKKQTLSEILVENIQKFL